PGIPEEFQPFLFEKFTQSSSGDTRQVGGTGLGLNISKMIIEKLGGTIGYKTIIDKETTFYFELPIVPHLSIDNDKTTKPQLMRL
ncbi:MAG: ATP-binding protein, partial [Gammaproteobacteria bacterium]|nr:ATP-binding protein [Gammaproteobacteria bacterium]